MAFSIIENKEKWDLIVSKIGEFDCYHTYDYHQITKNENDIAILVCYEKGNTIIAIPFLQRKIFDTAYYDLTSVYGYAGPIGVHMNNPHAISDFTKEFYKFLVDSKIISVFSRLHPLIKDQTAILNSIGALKKLGEIVTLDLTKTIEEQRSSFSKTTKRYIAKARKLCSVRMGKKDEDIEVFMRLYYENMDRVNAKKTYYFSKEYIKHFLNNTSFKTDLLLAIHNDTGQAICATMMMKTNSIIQYHLSGTDVVFLHLSPIRMLIDETRIMGTKNGFKFFNLGGGLGSKKDSLFQFKSSFSNSFREFSVWNFIVNQQIYDELVHTYAVNSDPDFFPRYRN